MYLQRCLRAVQGLCCKGDTARHRGKYEDIGGYRVHRILGFEVLVGVRGSRVLGFFSFRVFPLRGLHWLPWVFRIQAFGCSGLVGSGFCRYLQTCRG